MRRVDASCCLSGIGSVETPACRATEDSEKRTCDGTPLVEIMEGMLDDIVVEIMEVGDPQRPDTNQLKGKALGVAECIALLKRPYFPSVHVDVVRDEAMARYYDQHPEEDEVESGEVE